MFLFLVFVPTLFLGAVLAFDIRGFRSRCVELTSDPQKNATGARLAGWGFGVLSLLAVVGGSADVMTAWA